MLQDQYRESSKIQNEYKKLLRAWEIELSSNPSTDIKKSRISKSEHIQFTLMHLFNGYLDQIWTDSQNMLQCAQVWTSQSAEPHPSDAVFTMNILGLHLMKQSLRTRQEFFKIVDELNGISSINNDEIESVISSSDSTISQEFLVEEQPGPEHEFVDLEKYNSRYKNKSNDNSQPNFNYYDSIVESPLLLKKNSSRSISSSLKLVDSYNKPFRLISSPSTPTIGNKYSDTSCCPQSFQPACNYNVYYPRNEGVGQRHALSCHFCSEPVPLKKSFSFDNFPVSQHSSTYSTEGDERDDCSSFEIASFYYNSGSDNEEDIIERELLLEKPIDVMREKCQLLNNSEPNDESTKIEIVAGDYDSLSSSIIHYDIETKEIKKNKLKRNRQVVREIFYSSSTNSSQSTTYSPVPSDSYDTSMTSIQSEDQEPKISNEENTKSPASLSKNKLTSFMKKFIERKIAKTETKNSTTAHDIKISKLHLRNIFSSSRKQKKATHFHY
jgi:hypothetical protein